MIVRSRPRRLVDVALGLVTLGFAISIGWEVTRARPLPRSSEPAAPTSTQVPTREPEERPPAEPAAAATIAARNLFSASRGEATSPVATAQAGPKLVLHGVLVAEEKSRAYLEDPVVKRVFGYAVGDTIAGGRLEQISDDRVVIRRPDGIVEVMLQDPAKPRSAPGQPSIVRPVPAPAPATPPPTDKAPQ